MRVDASRWRLASALLMAGAFGMAETAQNGPAGQAASAPAPISITRENAPVVIHQLRESWRLETDGRPRRTLSARVTLQDESALQQWGQLNFPYSSEHESLTLKRLVITKPDGGEIAVDPQTLQDAPATESGAFESPTFSATRLKQVTVPALAEGDTVGYEVVIERHTPLHAGHFWTAFDRIVGRRVPLDAPDGTPFKVVMRSALTCSEGTAGCSLVIFAPRDALRLAREATRRP